MSPEIKPFGDPLAKILIIGDFPQPLDMLKGKAFSENHGLELSRMLHEAGILMTECRVTTLLKSMPRGGDASSVFDFKNKRPIGDTIPKAIQALKEEISLCKPHVIILLGGLPLFAAIGDSAITTWRGSLLSFCGIKAIPTYTPTQIRNSWDLRGIMVSDMKRAFRNSTTPDFPASPYNFVLSPSFDQVVTTLTNLLESAKAATVPLPLSVDLETRGGHTACTGIAWDRHNAICIPQMSVERPEGYFSFEEELEITLLMRELLTHPNTSVIGQNFLYDAQYFAKHFGFVPRVREDTMFQQHILFPGLPKGLDFLASMYCENYTYWKAEGKLWNPKIPETQLWEYNCKDACYTFEVWEVLREAIPKAGLETQYRFQMELWHSVLKMMLRGVRIDLTQKAGLAVELMREIELRNSTVTLLAGKPLNIKSPKQMKDFFYGELALPVQKSRKGLRQVTTDDEALVKLGRIEPLVLPLCTPIRELRSLGVFYATFVMASLSEDNRMRCSFNPAGTETYRFNSSKDAFGHGTNLQNIPSGDEDEEHEADALVLPNIRKLFRPDPEMLMFEVDLSGADAQVVAWEAHDDPLKDIFRSGQKLHAINAKEMFGADAGEDGKRMPYYAYAKAGAHLSNYGGKPHTLSVATGMTMRQSEAFQRRWFEIHPGIREWHREIQSQLESRRFVENKFGYRRFYFDRIESILPQALAWIPQSTVACITNRQLLAIDTNLKEVQILLQVHDSLVGQVRKDNWFLMKPRIRELLRVVVPYADPLVIPSGLKTSAASWGHCQDEKW